MRGGWKLGFVALAWAGGTAWWFREPVARWTRETLGKVEIGARPKFHPDPVKYEILKTDLERWRKDLARRHERAGSAAEREIVESDARKILELALPSMMRCWLGTPWDFHGTAERPGGGKIACGYFVATVLKDAGFQVDRYQLAQQPSENILRSFLAKEDCVLTVGKEYEAFAASIGSVEPGVYVIGLDTHVAFLEIGKDGFRFIHSSGSRPWCVVDESRDEADVLKRSNWRMLGNLTGNSDVLRRWLKGGKIAVRGT